MGGLSSRRKGAGGEREVRDVLRKHGFRCDRGQPPYGDLVHDVPGVHLEVKRCETWSLRAWLRQAEADARDGEVPWVVFRGSREPWRVVMPLEEALRLKRAEALLTEVRQETGVEFDDSRMGYVVLQMTRETWERLTP